MNNKTTQENLFLNALPFQFPEEPQTFHFLVSSTKKDFPFLTHQNRPVELTDAFPDLKNSDRIYTTFENETKNFIPVKINMRDKRNFAFAKRYYNRLIFQHFVTKGYIVYINKITKDNQIWTKSKYDNPYPECDRYDRFSLKVNYDNFNNTPQLILSFDRPTWLYKKSVAEIMQSCDDPFSQIQPSAELFGKLVYKTKDRFTKYIVDNYDYISSREHYDSENAYPIMNRALKNYLKIEFEDDEEADEQPVSIKTKPVNRYTLYYGKIYRFYSKHLNTDEFRRLINIAGFATVNPLQIGHTTSSSKALLLGNNKVSFSPQIGVN